MLNNIRCCKSKRIVAVTIVLVLSIGLTCLITSAQTNQSRDVSKGFQINPGKIYRAAFSTDSIYFLSLGGTSISGYSLIGEPDQNLDIAANGVVPLAKDVQDFVLDPKGNLHILAFVMPMDDSGVVRFDKATAQYSCVFLSKPIHAYHMDMDSQGNYYLLGYEHEFSESMSHGQGLPKTINLAHKYSANGRYIGSFLPIASPSTKQEFSELLTSLIARNNFAVLPSGDVYYNHFEKKIGSNTPPWDCPRTIYHANGQNFSSDTIEPQKPNNCWLASIHKHGNQLVYGWAEMKGTASKQATRQDGTTIGTIPMGGRIIAVDDDKAAILTPGPEAFYISFISMDSK
jgi:hypothetical protein